MSKQKLWLLKLKISLKSAAKVFTRPSYILLAVFGSLLVSGLILWSLNLDLVRYIIFEAPTSGSQKFGFFYDTYKSIYTSYDSVQDTGIVVFSVLFGINLALIVFVLKHRGFQAIPKKSGFGSFALAIVGGGCIACGTSIIAPLFATLGATSASFVRDLGAIFNWLGSLLIIYSIYKLGAVVSYVLAVNETQDT